MCLIQHDCIQFGADGSLDIAALTKCVQRIPIVNPNPACGDKLDAVEALACVTSCGDVANNMPCVFDCVRNNVEIAPGLEKVTLKP